MDNPRYWMFINEDNGDIYSESNNKAKLIAEARNLSIPATVVDDRCKGIIYENKAQRRINNGK